MLEDINIAEEFAKARKGFADKEPEQTRPYNLNLEQDNKVIVDLLESHGIHPREKRLVQIKTFPSGSRDLLVSNLQLGYLIRDISRPEGIKIMPDRLIVNIDSAEQTRFFLEVFRHICSGDIKYTEFQKGAYGAVGINPSIPTSSAETTLSDVCVKYFNLAFPFTQERYLQSLAVPGKVDDEGKAWNLSGVTGIGNYIALRYLAENGIPTPKVYLGTSELLIQQYIDGYTIADIKDHYEELKASGILGQDDSIINSIWDFWDEYEPKLTEAAQKAIEPIRHNYWSPDFQKYDINMGNIMISRAGLADPVHHYFVIDPFR